MTKTAEVRYITHLKTFLIQGDLKIAFLCVFSLIQAEFAYLVVELHLGGFATKVATLSK